ncbi:MAG: helix-turn-helix domain-containing protein [Chloroflexi bacterium]|nr:MAG: helix-turn-helix domain-containing protein [Chloroflexota bacterium]
MSEPLSVSEAATMLGVSHFTVRAWLRARLIPHYKLRRRIVLDRADVEAFLARRRVEADQP